MYICQKESMKEKQLQLLLGALYMGIGLLLTYLTYKGLLDVTENQTASVVAAILVDTTFYLSAFQAMKHLVYSDKKRATNYLVVAIIFGLISASSGMWSAHTFVEAPSFDETAFLSKLKVNTSNVYMKHTNLERFASGYDRLTAKQIKNAVLFNRTNWISKTKPIILANAKKAHKKDVALYKQSSELAKENAKSLASNNDAVKKALSMKAASMVSISNINNTKQSIIAAANIILFITQWAILYFAFWIEKTDNAKVIEVKSFFILPVAAFVAVSNYLISLMEKAIGIDLDGNGVVGTSTLFQRNKQRVTSAGVTATPLRKIMNDFNKKSMFTPVASVTQQEKNVTQQETQHVTQQETQQEKSVTQHVTQQKAYDKYSDVTNKGSLRVYKSRALAKRDVISYVAACIRLAELNNKPLSIDQARAYFVKNITNE